MAKTPDINNLLKNTQPIVDVNGNAVPNFGVPTQQQPFQDDGFIVPPIPSSDGNSLPSSKVKYGIVGNDTRRLIHWYIPEYGIVKMYVNPESITIANSKLIQQTKTKGGFTLQYWGEALTTLAINGTTGSSGIEGINVLYELYRAEEYAFDGVGLSLAATNTTQQQIGSFLSSLGGQSVGNSTVTAGQFAGSLTQSLLGSDIANQSLSPKNIPSLAQIAFGIEMYYFGWVYRGYFKDMNITESASELGLYKYTINFVATQRRGYRTNQFPWQKSATNGPSDSGATGLLTFKGKY